MTKIAVYFQETSCHSLEYKLVEQTTIREALLEKLHDLEHAVQQKRRVMNEECIIDMFSIIVAIRDSTFELLEQVVSWQKMYVHTRRPKLLNTDYLITLVKSTEFINSSPLKKMFNFRVGRGNVFIMPMSTGKTRPPVVITPAILTVLQAFTSPPIERLHSCYVILRNTLPAKSFNRIVALEKCLDVKTIWKPNVIFAEQAAAAEASGAAHGPMINLTVNAEAPATKGQFLRKGSPHKNSSAPSSPIHTSKLSKSRVDTEFGSMADHSAVFSVRSQGTQEEEFNFKLPGITTSDLRQWYAKNKVVPEV